MFALVFDFHQKLCLIEPHKVLQQIGICATEHSVCPQDSLVRVASEKTINGQIRPVTATHTSQALCVKEKELVLSPIRSNISLKPSIIELVLL